jgi:A/G-specific adenine glycosylase
LNAIRLKLARWYPASSRRLPWRLDRDPYRVLVSETMLVQTTVTAVVPYFERFLARFPTVTALAAAEEGEVVKAWEGLGYYRRARQLHAAAQAIVVRHGGVIPDDPKLLRALPGIGKYIAGAVLSIAFDRPAAIVEANAQRVLARLLAWPGELKAKETQARLWLAAERLVPSDGPGSFNQALMELGALVCTPRGPMCLVCPVSAECRARVLGLQDTLPVSTPKPPPLKVVEAAALVSRGGDVLIVRRDSGGLWEGFWEFPTIHVSGADPARRCFVDRPVDLAEGVLRLTGVRAAVGPSVKTVHFTVTNHRVRLDLHTASSLSGSLHPGPGLQAAVWERPGRLPNYPFSSAGRRLIEWILQNHHGGP